MSDKIMCHQGPANHAHCACLSLLSGQNSFQALSPKPINYSASGTILTGLDRAGSVDNADRDKATAVAASFCIINSANVVRAHNATVVSKALQALQSASDQPI